MTRDGERLNPLPSEVLVRLATSSDLAALDALVEQSFRRLGAVHYAPAQIDLALGSAIRVDRGLVGDGTSFAAGMAGELVGCGGWSAKIATAADALLPSPRAEVRAMFVAPQHARRGVGRALLRAAEAAIARAGFTVAYLLATRLLRASRLHGAERASHHAR